MTYSQKILVYSSLAALLIGSIGFIVLKYKNTNLTINEQEKNLINMEAEDNSNVVDEPSNTIDTSNWKTYKNDKFEIKYPPELIGKEIIWEGFSADGHWRSYIHFNLPRLGQYLYPTYKFEVDGPLIDCERGQSAPVWTNKQTVEIDGVMFTRGEYSYSGDEHINTIQYYGKYRESCYYLTYSKNNESEDNIIHFEQIVSTFSISNSR